MAVNVKEIEEKLGGSMDFAKREIVFRERTRSVITIMFTETICDIDYISRYAIEPLSKLQQNITNKKEAGRVICAAKCNEVRDTACAVEHILSGSAVIIFEPLNYAVCIEAKKIKTRPIEKSQFEPALFSAYESFNELLADNVSLIRKRMNTESLIIEKHTLGTISKTSAALLYIAGTAPDDLVQLVRGKLDTMDTDFVLNIESVAERLSPHRNLFDTIYYTEKPDTVVANLFEGRIAVLINSNPYALTAPYFFFETIHSTDDYASNRTFVTIVRFMRFAALLLALLLPGFYIALSTHHFSLIPTAFVFKLAVSRSGVPFPTVIEVLLLHFFFELAREAGRRMPQQIGQALSIVGALILGEAAVGAGLASQTTVVIVGIYAIASLINVRTTPWLTAWSVILVILSAAFGLHGFYLGFFLLLATVASLRSCNYPYLFPFGTTRSFKAANRDIFLRGILSKISKPFTYGGKNEKNT